MSEKEEQVKYKGSCKIYIILHNPKETYISCDPTASDVDKMSDLLGFLESEEAKLKELESKLRSTVYGRLPSQEKESQMIDLKQERRLSQIIVSKIQEAIKEIEQ